MLKRIGRLEGGLTAEIRIDRRGRNGRDRCSNCLSREERGNYGEIHLEFASLKKYPIIDR